MSDSDIADELAYMSLATDGASTSEGAQAVPNYPAMPPGLGLPGSQGGALGAESSSKKKKKKKKKSKKKLNRPPSPEPPPHIPFTPGPFSIYGVDGKGLPIEFPPGSTTCLLPEHTSAPTPNILSLPPALLRAIYRLLRRDSRENMQVACKAFHAVLHPPKLLFNVKYEYEHPEDDFHMDMWYTMDQKGMQRVKATAASWAETHYGIIIAQGIKWGLDLPVHDEHQRGVLDALGAWTQLQSVEAPAAGPVISTLVAKCPELSYIELSRHASWAAGTEDGPAPILWDSDREHMHCCLQALAACNSLRTLHFQQCLNYPLNKEGSGLLAQLTQLQMLHINYGINVGFQRSSAMPTLVLDVTDLNQALAHLTGLTALQLTSNYAYANKFEKLLKPRPSQSAPLPPRYVINLRALTRLQGLVLTWRHCYSVEFPAVCQLTKVLLPHYTLPTPDLERMQQLKCLHLQNTVLDDAAAAALATCSMLARLTVSGLSLTSRCAVVLPALSALRVARVENSRTLHAPHELESSFYYASNEVNFLSAVPLSRLMPALHSLSLAAPGKAFSLSCLSGHSTLAQLEMPSSVFQNPTKVHVSALADIGMLSDMNISLGFRVGQPELGRHTLTQPVAPLSQVRRLVLHECLKLDSVLDAASLLVFMPNVTALSLLQQLSRDAHLAAVAFASNLKAMPQLRVLKVGVELLVRGDSHEPLPMVDPFVPLTQFLGVLSESSTLAEVHLLHRCKDDVDMMREYLYQDDDMMYRATQEVLLAHEKHSIRFKVFFGGASDTGEEFVWDEHVVAKRPDWR